MKSQHLIAVFLLAALAGCRWPAATNPAAGEARPVSNPVGPVPGPPQSVSYRMNPYANDAFALQDGRRLFDWYNCSGCHGGHAGGGMGPSLRDPTWLYGSRDDQIFDSIAHGRSNGMPAWGTRVPESQIWELVAYIKSMGTSQEPDPPTEPADEMVPDPTGKTPPSYGTHSPEAAQ